MSYNEIEQKSINADNNLKKFKQDIASAITGKGVSTSPTANKQTFIDNINNISGGGLVSGTKIPLNQINPPTEIEKIGLSTKDTIYYNLGMEHWGQRTLVHGMSMYDKYYLTIINSDLTQQHIENVQTYCTNGDNIIVGLSNNKVQLFNSSISVTWEKQIPTVELNSIRKITVYNDLIYVLTGADAKEQHYIFVLNMSGEIVKQKYFGDEFTESDIYASEIKVTDTHIIVVSKKYLLVFNLELEILSKRNYDGTYGINFGHKQQQLFDMFGNYVLFTNNNIILINKVDPTQEFEIYMGVYYGYLFKQLAPDTILSLTDSKTMTKILKFYKNENGVSYNTIKEYPISVFAASEVEDGYICKTKLELYKLDKSYNMVWTVPVTLSNISEYKNMSYNMYDIYTGNEAIFVNGEHYYTHSGADLLKIDKIPCMTIK